MVMVAWCSLLSPFTENGVCGCVEVCEGMWGVHARMHTCMYACEVQYWVSSSVTIILYLFCFETVSHCT